MPAKKAVKKAAAKHADPKHRERKDLLRAYEHLGRVEALQPSVKGEFAENVHTLVVLAEKELGKGHRKEAADLLRAAEHFSFAALASAAAKSGRISAELREVVMEEVENLTHRANDYGEENDESQHHAPVSAIFRRSLEAAEQAVGAESFREALELSRGAEALAHVKKHGPEMLGSGSDDHRLPKP